MDTILFPARQSTAKESLAAYRERGGYEALSAIVGAQAPARVIEEVQAAGLRGRGGAAFPTGASERNGVPPLGPLGAVREQGPDLLPELRGDEGLRE